MKNVHLVIADLFLPKDFAASAGLRLPALQKILARGKMQVHPAVSCEVLLSELFGVHGGVAPVSAAFDGLEPGIWMRADPVHVRLQREQVVLLPNVDISTEESAMFCMSLNAHFAGQGMEFFAPHANRWYVRLDKLPDIATVPLSQASGRNIHGNLPRGADERRWRQLFNEIQMLLFAHAVNEAREAGGELAVNSLWFWGEGQDVQASSSFGHASSDEVLTGMLASSAGIPFKPWQPAWHSENGDELLVFTGLRSSLQRGDLAAWRAALQDFESGYAKPLWQALRQGKITRLNLDILGGDQLYRLSLERMDAWSFWRGSRRLDEIA